MHNRTIQSQNKRGRRIMKQPAALILIASVYFQSLSSTAFNINPIRYHGTALKVSTSDNENKAEESGSQPLFNLADIDMSKSFQIDDTYDEEIEEEDFDLDAIDVDYDLGYDFDDDDDDLYSTNIDDLQTSIYSNIQFDDPSSTKKLTAEDSYTRDDDEILTEREDRFYINEQGETRKREKCILIGVENLNAKRKSTQKHMSNPDDPTQWDVYFDLDQSMDEMKELINTCGMELAGVITQRLNDINPKTYIGTGKVKEAQDLLAEIDSCTVIFDAELSPGQQKALENVFNKEIIQNDFLGSETAVSTVLKCF